MSLLLGSHRFVVKESVQKSQAKAYTKITAAKLLYFLQLASPDAIFHTSARLVEADCLSV